MALQKDINYRGLTLSYWKLVSIEFNWHHGHGSCILAGFASKAARDAGEESIDVRGFSFYGPGFTGFAHDANNTQVAYDKIKSSPEFADAQDVLDPEQV